MNELRYVLTGIALVLLMGSATADTVQVGAPEMAEGSSWTDIALPDAADLAAIETIGESRIFWDLRPPAASGRLVRWTVQSPADAGLTSPADAVDADRALCATDVATETRLGCRLFQTSDIGATGPAVRWSDLPEDAQQFRSTLWPTDKLEVGVEYEATWRQAGTDFRYASGRVVAEGIALLPAGPHEVVLLRELILGSDEPRLRYRFLATTGEVVAVFEGQRPARGASFQPDRGAMRASPAADDGIEIPYAKLSAALVPGVTGFMQFSQENDTALTALDPDWTGVPEMIAIDSTNVAYQPDPTDPGSSQTLPEVWDFTGLDSTILSYRTFNTIRDDLAGNLCGEACAFRDTGPNPPDGTWQAYLKIDNYLPDGTLLTRDIFDLNNNDTGANPSIDAPYVAQNELDVDSGRTQICFEQSAGGPDRLLRFFQFTGPDPASAVLKVGDTWESGNWTECDNDHGLKLTATILCPSACWPECGGLNPRARGLLGNGVGLRSTIIEDGWVHVPPGNFVPALLMRQDTDIEAGIDFFGVCNLSPTRNRAFDYFWLHEDYGLLALVSSPADDTIAPDDWSLIGNITDGADFAWGPYPPYQTWAEACLSGTKVSWALPQDGSNLTGDPGVTDYGYVVSWGSLTDPQDLADWSTNPNHTALPGDAGYLLAPAGSEPTSTVITDWLDPAINATVITALRYTDPDVGDQQTYRSPAFYKVTADPARLGGASFGVGKGVAPFVNKSGADLTLEWPAVPGAGSYLVQVFTLDPLTPIDCPVDLNCTPTLPTTTHVGAGASLDNYGYRVVAVDPCGEPSAD